ncbi:hypothetical protein K2173_013625 [Erythroxylum novogranatense]|uniref:Uncharacterized protein n=1 Tax=Erythroxylum novogranatense TaxID=1862640 RepID=A0AAV8TLW8_9ROSI|nr:hypothetical protein K2173_013625 [Erythroxylum novogranatense]
MAINTNSQQLLSFPTSTEPALHDRFDEQEGFDVNYWEFVNQSDADSDNESLVSVEDGFVALYRVRTRTTTPSVKSPEMNEETGSPRTTHSGDDGDDHRHHEQDDVGPIVVFGLDDGFGEQEDEEEEEDGYGYGLDDELVPLSVRGKFGKQRMRKLGKRVFAKMIHSKRNPHLFVKPGCVRGKYGLGMKA